MKGLKNNKGSAFLTVLIAILFIGILGTSLLYLATTNYISKSMRYNSTDNFYTDEYGLAELTTALQNACANQSSCSAAVSYIKTNYMKTSGSIKYYDGAALTALIKDANKEANVVVDTAVDVNAGGVPVESNFIESKSSIKLKGLRITSTDENGYRSVITTDVTLFFEPKAGTMDVNSFSVLTDSPVELDNKVVIWAGNCFVGSGSGTTAVTVENQSVLNILGDKGIIHGDMNIEKGCIVTVTGDLTVYGDVNVSNGATFICTGNLWITGDVKGSGIKKVKSKKSGEAGDEVNGYDIDDDSVNDRKLATYIFDNIQAHCSCHSGSGTDAWHSISLNDILSSDNNIAGTGTTNTATETKPDGTTTTTTVNTRFGADSARSGEVSATDNMLLLESDSAHSSKCNIRDDISNSTIVSEKPIRFYDNYCSIYLTNMSSARYIATKEAYVMFKGNKDTKITISGHDYYFNEYSGTLPAYPNTGDNANFKEIEAASAANGTPQRYTYYDGTYNYVPAGYFIASDSSAIISKAFAATQGKQDPKNTYVIYNNWNKE